MSSESESSDSKVEYSGIPHKALAKLCGDCKRLFQRQEWSWEYDTSTSRSFHDTLHEFRVSTRPLPRPHLYPKDIELVNIEELIAGCQLCGKLVKTLTRVVAEQPVYKPQLRLDLSEVEHFEWFIRLSKQ